MTEITRAQRLQQVEELRQKISSGNYVKESDWTYDPWYGLIRTQRPDTETLRLLEKDLADDTKWVLKRDF